MKPCIFFLLAFFGLSCFSQNIPLLESEHGFEELRLQSTKSEIKGLEVIGNALPEWYSKEASGKYFCGWLVKSEKLHFSDGKLDNIALGFLGAWGGGLCSELIGRINSKYGRSPVKTYTPTYAIYTWISDHVSLTVIFNIDKEYPDKFNVKAVYSYN